MPDTIYDRAADVPNIDLGIRLNHLLEERTLLGEDTTGVPRGLVLPTIEKVGSGIVVIVGEPGSGKSTLGLQIAATAAIQRCDSAYISLEEEPDRIRQKANFFGWKQYLWSSQVPLDCLETKSGPASASDPVWMRKLLEKARLAPSDAKTPVEGGRILLPGLLPRPLSANGSRLAEYFWEQYRQIEFLVRSAADHVKDARISQDKNDKTGIRLVVIDSLNMLGVEPQNREMLHRLFDLFRQNQVLGVFTVEANSDVGFDATMGDVVFNFSRKEDSGYEVSLIECSKSRFSKQTNGLHPYKIKALRKDHQNQDESAERGEIGIVVFPSPHAVVAATEGQGEEKRENNKFSFGWGDEITECLLRSSLHGGEVVALAGPSGTFKTQVGHNFLLHGMVLGHSVLYLRLRTPEPLLLQTDMVPYGEPVLPERPDKKTQRKEEETERSKVKSLRNAIKGVAETDNILSPITSRTKVKVSIYQESAKVDGAPMLVVADFRTGMLLAEEFIDIIRRIFRKMGKGTIKRVVLDDVGSIGASYPLLKHSITTGDLFLSAFVHVMKNYGVDLLLIGTTGDLPEANHMVHQACSLADAALRSSVGAVFGDKYILLTGDGMAAKIPNQGDNPPVVLRPQKDGKSGEIVPDAVLLDEFVGFDSGRIQRPGIALHLYEENKIQERYNRGLWKRLQDRYGMPSGGEGKEDPRTGVRLLPFRPGGLPRLGSSNDKVPHEPPRDHTAVRMIDEFEAGRDPGNLYARNVLLMAYRWDVPETAALVGKRHWADVLRIASAITPGSHAKCNRTFAFDRLAPETLACLVLEAIAAGNPGFWPDEDIEFDFPADFGSTVDAIARECEALHKLMFTHTWTDHEKEEYDKINKGHPRTHDEKREYDNHEHPWTALLPPDSAIYVCWYSQLRELLCREHHLVRLLKICSLPADGFTGDWYLRVEPGSVSLRLGETIVKDLCLVEEDYERFLEGLSLPTAKTIEDSGLLAWPGADPKEKLKAVTTGTAAGTNRSLFEIWNQARKRSKINNYNRFNRLLYVIGETLAGKHRDPNDTQTPMDIPDLVRRLPALARALTPGREAKQ